MPCGEMESRKAMFASMSSGALTAVCVFLCEWMCVCAWGRVKSHSALRQCIPRPVCVCVCVCVNGLCSQWNRVKTYCWSILSRIHKQVCVCATTSERLQVCATCSWGNFNDVYISSMTTECVCEVWSRQTGVRKEIGSATVWRSKMTKITSFVQRLLFLHHYSASPSLSTSVSK